MQMVTFTPIALCTYFCVYLHECRTLERARQIGLGCITLWNYEWYEHLGLECRVRNPLKKSRTKIQVDMDGYSG